MSTMRDHDELPDTVRSGPARARTAVSGTQLRAAPASADAAYRSAEATSALASGIALLLEIARKSPVSPTALAALPPLDEALDEARREGSRLYALARSLESAGSAT